MSEFTGENMGKKKEQTLCEFEKPKLTGHAQQERKRIHRETVVRPLLRICTIGSIGWVLVMLFLYYYLPELFESEAQWFKMALIGPGIIWLLFLTCLLRLWLGSLSTSKYVMTDRAIRYTSGEHSRVIRWKDVDGYIVEEAQKPDEDTQTVLLYRKNRRVRPFVLLVPAANIERVMGIIGERVEPLDEELPDFRAEAIRTEKDLKSMFAFSLVVGLLGALLLQPQHFRFLRHVRGLTFLLFFVVGPGTLWLLLHRPRKIRDAAYLALAFFCNMVGNGIMFFILMIKYLRDVLDKA
jgi:hypothetical protein